MILPIDDVILTLAGEPAVVDEATKARIAAHWEAAVAANPALWNGTVLGVRAPGAAGGLEVRDGLLTGEAALWDFASFLAWRDWGFPEIGIRNVFGSALVRGTDGPLIYGVMGGHTANAGRIYPPGGSLEPRDVTAEGRVDVFRSIETELREETGLDHREAAIEGTFVAFDGPRVSVGRVFRFPQSVADLAARIRVFLAAEIDPELSDVAVMVGPEDAASDRVPPYARMYAEHLLGP